MMKMKLSTTACQKQVGLLRQVTYVASLVISDTLIIILSLQLAVLVRNGVVSNIFPNFAPETFPLAHYADFWWILPIWLLLFAFEGLYFRRRSFWDETQALWKAITLATMAIFAVVAVGKLSPWVSRLTLVLNWVFLMPLMPLSRLGVKKLLFRLGLWRRRVLILGAAKTGKLVLKTLNREPLLGYQVAGFLDDDPEKRGAVVGTNSGEPVRVIGVLSQTKEHLKQTKAKDVIIAMPGLNEEKLISLVRDLQAYANQIRIVPNLWGLPAMSPQTDHFLYNHLFMISLSRSLVEPSGRLIKRAFDILIAGGVLLLALPLFAMIAIAIKLNSRGPVFYRWRVVGYKGRPFISYKFRSMYENADQRKKELLDQNEMKGPVFKLKNDPRITAVGRVLRKFSLDEFPQLWSVLKGDMSLVGPRPVLPDEWEQFEEWQKGKLTVKPGMISLWHISGKPRDFHEWVRLDLEYIDRWSLWLDLKILLLGIPYIVLGKGETVTEVDAEEEKNPPSRKLQQAKSQDKSG